MIQNPAPHFFLFIVIAIITVTEVEALPTLQANLQVSSATALGEVHGASKLIALIQEKNQNSIGDIPSGFYLETENLRIESDESDPSLTTPIITHQVQPTSASITYSNAKIQGTDVAYDYRWTLFSADEMKPPMVEWDSGCASASPPKEKFVARNPNVDFEHRMPTSRNISGALQWGCLEGATIKVTGDFQLSLWSWNAILTADGGVQRELRTGPQRSDYVPEDAPDLSATVSRDREIYLFATNATLTVPLLAGAGYTLLTGAETTVTAQKLKLGGAHGELSLAGQTRQLKYNQLEMDGAITATFSGVGVQRPFMAWLSGTPQTVQLEGLALTLPTSAGIPWWPLWTLVGAVLPALLVPTVRHLRSERRFRLGSLAYQCRELLNRGHTEEAFNLAAKILDLNYNYPMGQYLLAGCLGAMETHGTALAHHRIASDLLRKAKDRDTDLMGENALQAALTAASSPEPNHNVQVTAWLEAALDAKPSIRDDLPDFEELRPYLQKMGLRIQPDPAIA